MTLACYLIKYQSMSPFCKLQIKLIARRVALHNENFYVVSCVYTTYSIHLVIALHMTFFCFSQSIFQK